MSEDQDIDLTITVKAMRCVDCLSQEPTGTKAELAHFLRLHRDHAHELVAIGDISGPGVTMPFQGELTWRIR